MQYYLIAHKVRGTPAFDVAIRVCESPPCTATCGLWDGSACSAHDEEEWIIPTTGHRAHPFWWNSIDTDSILEESPMPASTLDHYSARQAPAQASATANSLLTRLGLGRPKPQITRRV